MTDANRYAYLVVCGTTLGGEADPEYANRAGAAAKNINITPIASGNVRTERLKVLKGGLPPGVTFTAVERFPSMAAIEEFWFSDAYQSSIPFRENAWRFSRGDRLSWPAAAPCRQSVRAPPTGDRSRRSHR